MDENELREIFKDAAMLVSQTHMTQREGSQCLWNIGGRYVVTSTSKVFGWETYVFHADSQGKITDWLELPGSFKGKADHRQALQGYLERDA